MAPLRRESASGGRGSLGQERDPAIPKFWGESALIDAAANENAAWLASLGYGIEQRLQAINAIYDAKVATISATFFQEYRTSRTIGPAGYMFFRVSRSLSAMDNREREYLRVADLLNCANDGKYPQAVWWKAALLWADGRGTIGPGFNWRPVVRGQDVQNIIGNAVQRNPDARFAEEMRLKCSIDQTISEMYQDIERVYAMPNVNPAYRALLDDIRSRISPSGSGAWLTSAQVGTTVFAPTSPFSLRLGSFADRTGLTYSGDGSMVTIAPPGSGKTSCHVYPNLLTWAGPAIVLDLSGEIFENTAGWRAAKVGPVFKFNPLDPENSHKFNPLTFVRREPDFIWEDSRLLAELMIVPAMSTDPFWENEAKTVLTAAIAYVTYAYPPENRPMHALLDVLFGGQAWDNMIFGLKMAVDVRVMVQHATALSSMSEKTLSGVLQTARASLSAWTGERVARATATSDWNPLDLRNGSNTTIYICVRPSDVEAYLSLLRVFIGQHIRVLTGGAVPARDAPPILLMLDELPRLRYMAPIDEALNIGRKYGLRLWMFAQSVGQLQSSYENADGMLGSCAVRIYMNPSGADGLAERLSEELGYVDSASRQLSSSPGGGGRARGSIVQGQADRPRPWCQTGRHRQGVCVPERRAPATHAAALRRIAGESVSWLLPVGTPGGICSGYGNIDDGDGLVRLGDEMVGLHPELYRMWHAAADEPELDQLLTWAASKAIDDPAELVSTLVSGRLLVTEHAGVVDEVGDLSVRLLGECLGNGSDRGEQFLVSGRNRLEISVDAATHEILLRTDGVSAIGVLCDAFDAALNRSGRASLAAIVNGLPLLVRSGVVRLDASVR